MMAGITFQFDRRKAIETILYLANRISDADIYGICKLLYFADKVSLEEYGRFIYGETYVAMKQGATPSHAYDILKEASEEIIEDICIDGYDVVPLRDANNDFLSESDIESLNATIENYGDEPNLYRWKDAHDEAWESAWDERGDKNSWPIPIEYIAKTLSNSKDLIDYLLHRDAD
jgi:uncharacterized phage-associated protein